ncbi:hypothetical protein C2S51_028024 [Perilla frutescens var. frutescens]|nr:hypothetical protein C2S51_028024 [Perilla frutescens var. frutescens]
MSHFPNISINHFTHPRHPLTLDSQSHHQSYLCNGCKTLGTGRRFRCIGCNFDLHEYCAACPNTLSLFMHRNHDLKLMMPTDSSGATQVGRRSCAVCADPLIGMFYHCNECNFNLHPLCSRFSETLCHPAHSAHPLIFEFPSASGLCRVCQGFCNRWRYRCPECHFDIHFACMVPIRPPTVQLTGPVYSYGHGYNSLNPRPQNQIMGFGNYNGVGGLGNRIFEILQQLGINLVSSAIYDALTGS